MPQDLYVYIRTGPRNVLIQDVTAAPTITTETIKSPPYRDVGHRGLAAYSALGTGNAGDVVLFPATVSGGVLTPDSIDYGIASGVVTAANQTYAIVSSVPDNVSHTPPRQADIVVPFWTFVTASMTYKFPVSEVIGWGDEKLST